MRINCQVVPCVAAGALALAAAACTTSTDATVQLHPVGGWTGTADVLVHHPDGSMASRTKVSSKADVAIDDGDSVTVVLHDAGGTFVDTWTHVQRGDEIDAYAYPSGQSAFVDAAVTMPSPSGATTWIAAGPQALAESSDASLTMSVPVGRTTVPVIGTAYDATHALAMYGNKSAAIDPTAPAIALSQPIDFQMTSVTITGAPSGSTSTSAGGALYVGDDDLLLLSYPSGTPAALAVPTSFGDSTMIEGFAGGTSSVYAGTVYAGAPPAAVTIDLSATELPTISALAIAPDHLSWSLTGGAGYDVVSAYLSSSATATYQWSVASPPGTTSIVLPVLPADLAPPVFDAMNVYAFDRSDLDGYADVMGTIGNLPTGAHFVERSISILPASGVAPRASHGKLDPRAVPAAVRR